MQNVIKRFNHPQFGEIRIYVRGEKQEPWFVGKDVAKMLGYKDASKAVYMHVDDEDKTSLTICQCGTNYQAVTTIINESGLYSMILSSKLPQAREFKHWVTAEVLPAIRKTGSFTIEAPHDELTLQMHQTLQKSQQLILLMGEKLQDSIDTISALSPKAEYCDQVLDAPNCLTTSQVAKDLGMSAIALNQLLHECGVQYKQSQSWMLYADWQDKELVDYRTRFVDGRPYTDHRMVWTQLGRAWIINIVQKGMSPREAWQSCLQLCN